MQSRQKPSHGSKAEKNRMASWLWVGFSIRRTCQVPLPMLAAWVSVSDVEPAADLIRQATCSTDVPSDWNRLHVSMQWKFMDTLREQNNFWCTVITISKCCNPKKIEKVRFTTTLQFRSGERERESDLTEWYKNDQVHFLQCFWKRAIPQKITTLQPENDI